MTYHTFLNPEQTDSSEDESEYILTNLFKVTPKTGYSVWTAAIFITSLMAGMGVLALSHALAGTGWYGILLMALACVNSWYSATILGRTWMMLEERWEEYRGKFRYPYPAMGLRSFGPCMRYTVTATLHITLIGVAVVYILLSAQIALSMTSRLFPLDYGHWIIILSVVLCPLTWFGSIEEFWFAAVGALATAALACYSLVANVILEIPKIESVKYDTPTFSSFSLAFGTILFSFGGVFSFPTIQNDMANRQQFKKATVLGFVGLLLLYMPVTIAGYAVFGSSVSSNILLSLEEGYLRTFIEACLAAHILLAFLLVLNPVAQEIEDALEVESSFNYKRCIVRTFIVGLVLLISYTIPHFDKILNLIGGSTMTLLTFIFPPIFYIRLSNNDASKVNNGTRDISLWEKVFLLQVMIVGIAGGIACTYFALIDIVKVFLSNNSSSISDMSFAL